jgi:hypothetical protein
MSRKLVHRRHDALLRKYEAMKQHADTKVVAQQHLARVLSLQHSVATAWLLLRIRGRSMIAQTSQLCASCQGSHEGLQSSHTLSVLAVTGVVIAITPRLLVTQCRDTVPGATT